MPRCRVRDERATLNPISIVRNRRTAGGPQPAEMSRMLDEAKQRLAEEDRWIVDHRTRIDSVLGMLDGDFNRLLAAAR